jgi:hypothetical protein
MCCQRKLKEFIAAITHGYVPELHAIAKVVVSGAKKGHLARDGHREQQE